jgi:hypothetical protein
MRHSWKRRPSPRKGDTIKTAAPDNRDAFCTPVEPYRRELHAHC